MWCIFTVVGSKPTISGQKWLILAQPATRVKFTFSSYEAVFNDSSEKKRTTFPAIVYRLQTNSLRVVSICNTPLITFIQLMELNTKLITQLWTTWQCTEDHRLGPHDGTTGWDYRLGPQAGTTGWDYRMGPQDGTTGWDHRLGLQAGTTGWDHRMGPLL